MNRYILPSASRRPRLNIVIAQEQELQSLSAKLEESESGRRAAVSVKEALEKVCPTSLKSRHSTECDTGSGEALLHSQ